MDVPAPFAGVVSELQVKVGDRVSQGSLLLTMEASDGGGGAAVEGVAGCLERGSERGLGTRRDEQRAGRRATRARAG